MSWPELELFLSQYSNTAWAFFTSFAFILTIARIILMIKNANEKRAKELIDRALIDQRQQYQSQHFDVMESRYSELLYAYPDAAINAAICKKILEDRNIRAFKND